MSSAFYIALEREIPGFDAFVNGKAISKAWEELDAVATALGVTPFMKFYGGSWRQPSKGLATVRAVTAYLQDNPGQITKVELPYLLKDLEQWEQVLKVAESNKVRWHMLIDY